LKKDKQCNGQNKRGKETNNAMAKTKEAKRQTMQWPKQKRQRDKQCNGQNKRGKETNNDQQNTSQKTKDWTTPTTLKKISIKQKTALELNVK
jgi:hypothetical protein